MTITPRTRKRCKKIISVIVATAFVYVSSVHQAAYLFAQTYGPVIGGKVKEYFDRANSGYLSPQNVQRSIDKQNAVVDYLNRRESLLDRQRTRILDKVSANIDQAAIEHQQNVAALQREAELARQKAFSILGQKALFNYALYADGRKVWLKDGNAVRVENERIVDARGNVTIKNTYDMVYDEKKLLVSYNAEQTDSLGNTTRIKWYGGTYTDDSVHYADDSTHADKLITGYTQETTDAFGNTSKIVWSGATYRDKNLTAYREACTDVRGNTTTKDWTGGKYDENGQLTEYRETVVDARGVRTERFWTGGTYVKNSAYDEAKALRGEGQDIPEYLLTGYHEEVTDDRGNRTVRDWTNAEYDEYGQLVSYREVTAEPSGRQVTTEWRDAEYDDYGRLAFYEEQRTDSGGAVTKVRWRADEYAANGRNTAYTETTIDGSGSETTIRRYGLLYDNVGNVLSYAQDETNSHGKVSRTVWENAVYDAYGQLTGYDEATTDPLGAVTKRHWGDAVLDAYGRLVSYREENFDPFNNRTVTVWENGTYNALGQLVAYRETATDPLGHATVKEWSNATYDACNRLASYHEADTDVFGFTTATDWTAGGEHGEPGYDAQSRLANYKEVGINIYGESCTRYWTNGTYGTDGKNTGYTEVLIGPDGTSRSTRTWVDATYDAYGRLAGYTETYGTASGTAGIRRWNNAVYDAYGRLLRYTEIYDDGAGCVMTTERTATAYDALSRTLSWQETIAEADGTTTSVSWAAGAFDPYGRTLGYTRTSANSANPHVTVTTTAAGRTFDSYGQQSGGSETTSTTGVDAHGDLINLNVTTTLQNAAFLSGALRSYERVTRTTGLGPGAVPLDMTETVTVSGMTAGGWSETRRTAAAGYDRTVWVTRSGVIHNREGVIIAYTDVMQDQATPGGTTTVERKNTTFNGKGEVVSYDERFTDLAGTVTDQSVCGMFYNGSSQVLGYTQRNTCGQGSEVSHETTVRNGMSYDLAGRMVGYTETVKNEGDPRKTVTAWQAQSFSAAGLVTADITNTTVKTPVLFSLFSADHTTCSERTSILYNTLGQAVSYNERVTDSRQADLVTDRVVNSIVYDRFGQAAQQYDETHTSGTARQSLPELADLNERMMTGAKLLYAGNEFEWDTLTAPQKTRLLNGETVTITVGAADLSLSIADNSACVVVQRMDLTVKTTRDLAVLNARGRVETYRETVETRGTDGAGHLVLDKTEVRLRESTTYDAKGHVTAYRDREYSSETPGAVTVTDMAGMQYDVYGRVSSFAEKVTRTGTVGGAVTLLLETQTNRTGITYDGASGGRVCSYTETVIRSDTPGVTLTTERMTTSYDAQGNVAGYRERSTDDLGYATETTAEDVAYNGFGLETGRKETIHTTAAGAGAAALDVTQVIATSHIRYNGAGQKVSYVEKIDQDNTDTVTTTQWGDGRYNLSGQLEGFYRKKTIRNAGGLSTWETTERTATTYNTLGQETATAEKLAASDAPGIETTETTTGITYNKDGYRKTWHAEKLQEARSILGALTYGLKTVTDRTASTYDGRGQLHSFTEDIARSSTEPGTPYAVNSHVERGNIAYSSARLMTSYDETTIDNGAVTVQTVWSGTYDNDRLTGFVKTDTDITDPAQPYVTTTRRQHTSYTSAGFVDGYEETVTHPTGLETFTRRRSTSYNAVGSLLGYTEETVSGDQPNILTTNVRSGCAYNAFGLITSFDDEATAVETDAHGAVALGANGLPAQSFVKTCKRTATTYNTCGFASSYDEQAGNSATGMTTTTGRSAMAYNALGLLDAYTDTIRERAADGAIDYTTTVNRLYTTYTGREQAEDYRETRQSTRTPGITETVEYDATVNGKGQTEEFTKKTFQNLAGIAYDLCLTSSRSGITYDGAGRVYAYAAQELSSAEPDVLTDTTRSYTTYDGFGGEKTFTQTVRRHTADLSLDIEEETTRTDGLSTVAGLEASCTETLRSSKAPDTTVTRTRSGATYRYGMTDGYIETLHRQGTDSATGNTLDVTQTTTRLYTEYDGRGFVEAQKETSVSTAESGIVSSEEYQDIAYDDMGRRTTCTRADRRTANDGTLNYASTTERTAVSYYRNGTLAGYTEKTVASDSPDVTTTVQRSNTLYNGRGQATSYDEHTLKLAKNLMGLDTLRQESAVSRTLITCNDQGETLSYHDAVTTNFEGNSTKDWVALSFDGFGRMTGYRETGATPAQGNYTKTTTAGYDALGRQESTTETLVNDSAGTSVTSRSSSFNDKGQVVAYTETGTADESPSYSTTFKGDYADAYDAAGRQVHFRETTETGGITTVRERAVSAYNGLGQLTSYTESAEESAPGFVRTVSAKNWEGEYNVKGSLDNTSEETVSDIYAWGDAAKSYTETKDRGWSDAAYDARGLLTSFRETNSSTVRTPAGALVQQTGGDYTRSAITYNAGRLASYHEEGSDTSQGDYEKDWAASAFTVSGKAAAFTEAGYSSAGGPNDYTRNNIDYDAQGRLLSYDDYGIMGGKYAKKHWETTAAKYDLLGRPFAFSESGWSDNGYYARTQTSAGYDLLGRLVSSIETGNDLSDGNYRKTVTGTTYDTNGRRNFYRQSLAQLDTGRSVETTWQTAGAGYNALGQLTGYKETGTASEGGSAVEETETVWTALLADAYTARGQLARYTSTVTKTSLVNSVRQVVTTDRHGTEFAADGRASGYTETGVTVTSNANDPSQQKEERTATVRSDIEYYTAANETADSRCREGMLARYKEFVHSSIAAEKPRQVIADNLYYDAASGALLDSTEVAAEENLANAALRRFTSWLELSKASAVLTDGWELASCQLAQLFGSVSDLADRAAGWLDAHKADLTADPALWPSRLGVLRSFMDNLAVLLSGAPLDAAMSALFTLVRGQVGDLGAVIDKLGLLSASLLPGQPATVLPDVPYALTALGALKPFDYTATVTRRTNLKYDAAHRLTGWREYAHASNDREAVTVSDVEVTYEGLSSRYATYAARMVETKNVAGIPLSLVAGADAKVTHLFRHGYSYNALGMADSYTETTFEGDTLFTTQDEGGGTKDETADWRTLDNARRIALINGFLANTMEVRETVTIKRYSAIRYSAELQMADFDLVTEKRGYAFQEFSEAQEMIDSLAKQQEILAAQHNAVTELLDAVEDALRSWADSSTNTGAYYTAKKLYEDTKASIASSDPALDKYFSGNFPDSSNVEAVKVALNNVLSYLVEVEADKEVLVNSAQDVLSQRLAEYNQAKKELDQALEAFAAADKAWRNTDPANGPLGCLTIANALVTDMKADLFALQNGKKKLEDDTATLAAFNDLYVKGDATYGARYAAIDDGLAAGSAAILSILNAWALPDPAKDTAIADIEAMRDNFLTLEDGIARMLDAAKKLGAVINARTSVAGGVTGDLLKKRDDAQTAFEQARAAYDLKYKELFGNYSFTEDGSAPASPGGLLGAKNAADAALAAARYESPDPDNILGDAASANRSLATAVSLLYNRYNYYLSEVPRHNGLVTSYNNSLWGKVNDKLWDGSYTKWHWKHMKDCTWHYQVFLRWNGSRYWFEYNDDGDWYEVSRNSAVDISDSDGDVVNCRNWLNGLESNRRDASSDQASTDKYKLLYDDANRQYTELLDKQAAATQKYNSELAAMISTQLKNYTATKAAYEAAQKTYDDARRDYGITAGQDTKFSGYSRRAVDNHAAMVSAAATLITATNDKTRELGEFAVATKNLEDARAAFNSAMAVFTAATAKKDEGEAMVGNLLDTLAGLERVQADLACEQATESLITADAGTLVQSIVAQLQKHEYLVGGAVQTVSAPQAADLAAGKSITFAGASLTLDALLSKLKTDASLKISAGQTTTTARRNITYDALGYLDTYDELSFTGKDIVWNGSTVAWDSLTAAQKGSVFGATPPSIALTGAGALTVTRGLEHQYDGEGKLVKSAVSTRETRKREDSSDTYTHEFTVTTDNIEYAGDNVKRYRKTTADGLKTTVEETTGDLRYDLEDRLVESGVRTTETVRLADGTVVYAKTRDVRTGGMEYNELGQMTRYLRVTNDCGRITVEKTIGDAAYNRQGQLVYSHNRVVETTAAGLATVLAQIAAGTPTTGKVTEVIMRDAEYDSRDLVTKMTRTVIEGDKRTDEVTTMTYDAGRMKSSASAMRESAVPSSGKLFYRSYSVSQNVTAFYFDTELAAAQTRTTTEGGKVSTETSSALAYDASGRLTHSLVEMQESYGGVSANPYTVETTIHQYDADNNVSHQTRVTRESGKTVTETNWNAATDSALYAGMTYADGNLLVRKVLVTEKGEKDDHGAVTAVYEKHYVQTENYQEYDSIGQLLRYVRNTETADAATGNRTNTEETITNEYNIRGHIRESAVIRNKYDNGDSANGKKTTQVTRISPSGYNASNQMENYTTVAFDGDRVQLDRTAGGVTSRVKLAWTGLSEAEKRGIINGEHKAAHDDIISVTFMNNVAYNANRMTSWTATARTLGPITVGLQTLLTSTFKGADDLWDKDKTVKIAFFDATIGKGTILLDPAAPASAVPAGELTEAEKLAILNCVENDLPVTLRGMPLLDAKNNELVKIRVPMDTTSVTVRRATSYDAWDRMTGYDEINLEGRGIFLNGVFHSWNSLSAAEQDALITEWDRCLSDKPEKIAQSEVNLLPNNFVTRTRMWGMTYTGQNDLQGYMSTKHELQLLFTDVRAAKGTGDVPLAVNRVTRSHRSECVKNALGQEIAVKETVINPNNSGTESWTFFSYQDGKAKELLKFSQLVYEDNLGVITKSGQWTMEHTTVDEYTSLAGVDLFKKIHTDTTRDLTVKAALESSTLESFLAGCGGNLNLIKTKACDPASGIAEKDELAFEYVYDKVSNAPVVSRTTRLHRDVENIPTIDDTFYYYAKSDTKPSHIRTVTVNAPVFDAAGSWTGAGIRSQEDSVLEYNASGLVKRTSAVKQDGAGLRTYEVVDYSYSLTGQVGKTVKQITQDLAGNFKTVENSAASTYIDALPVNFLFYDSGGATTTETTFFTYQDDNRIKTTDVIRTNLSGGTSAEHGRYYYNTGTGRLDRSITVALEGADGRADLAPVAALTDAVIGDSAQASVELQQLGFAWDYTRRSNMSYDAANAFLAGYTENALSCEAPGKETVSTTNAIAYDSAGKMTGKTTNTKEYRLSDNAVLGSFTCVFTAGIAGDPEPAYDSLGRLSRYTQKTTYDSALTDDRNVTEKVVQSYSASDGRVIMSDRTITEKGTSAAGMLNHTCRKVTSVTAFDAACPGLPSREVTTTYDGDRISTDEAVIAYDAATRRMKTRTVNTRVTTAAAVTDKALQLDARSRTVTDYTGAQYDALGQADRFSVTTTQNGKTTVQSVKDIVYNDDGQVVSQFASFRETVAGKTEAEYLREWSVASSGQAWDGLGLMTAGKRVTAERGKQTEETLSGMAYDAAGRLARSTAKTYETDIETDASAAADELVKRYDVTTVNTYDSRGLVTDIIRTTGEYDTDTLPEDGTEKVVRNITETSKLAYDAQERVRVGETETVEKDNEASPGTKFADRYAVTLENTYDLATGLVDGMVRTRKDNYAGGSQYYLQTREEISDITYDRYGRTVHSMSGFTETNLIGTPGTLHRTYRVITDTAFDALDRMTDYTRTTVEGIRTTVEDVTKTLTYSKRGNLLQTETRIIESSLDGAVKSTSDVATVFAGYDDWGRATGYTRITIDRDAGAPAKDTKTVETVSGLVYHPSGQVKESFSAVTQTDVHAAGGPAEGTYLARSWTVKTEGMGYNSLGFTNAYVKTTVENGKTTNETMTAAAYDAAGRMSGSTISYTETGDACSWTDTAAEPDITYTAPALNHTWSATMANITYGGSGQMNYYEKTTADGTKQSLEKATLTYTDGRMTDLAVQYTDTDTAGALNHTYTVRTHNTYGDYDRVTGYTRTTIDGKTTVETVTGQTYDRQNRILRYAKETLAGDLKTTETLLDDIVYDALGRVLVTHIRRAESDAAASAASPSRLNDISEITHRNLKFDALGRMVRYHTITEDLNHAAEKNRTTEDITTADMTYTGAGQLQTVAYTHKEYGVIDSAATGATSDPAVTVELDELSTESSVSLNYTAYAANGQAAGFTRTTVEGARTSVDTVAMTYDAAANQLATSKTDTHEYSNDSATAFDTNATVRLSGISYDSFGRISAMTRKTWMGGDTAANGKATTETVLSQTYDTYGRLVYSRAAVYEESAYLAGLAHSYTQTMRIGAGGYNALGQVVKRTVETSGDSGAPDRVTAMTQSDIRYDKAGRTFSYTQVNKNNAMEAMDLYTQRAWTLYNTYDQANKYEENSWKLGAAVQEMEKLLDGDAANGELDPSGISFAAYVDSLGNAMQNVSIADILSRLDDATLYTDGAANLAQMKLSQIFAGLVRAGLTAAGVTADTAAQASSVVLDNAGAMLVENNAGEKLSLSGTTVTDLLFFLIGSDWDSCAATAPDGADADTDPDRIAVAGLTLSAAKGTSSDVKIGGVALRDMTLDDVLDVILKEAFMTHCGLTAAQYEDLISALDFDIRGRDGSGTTVSLLDTAVKDIVDPDVLCMSFEELIKSRAFAGRSGNNAQEIYTRAMQSEVQNLQLLDGTAGVGTAGMASLLFGRLAGAKPTLQERIVDILKGSYSVAGYKEDTKVTSLVTGALYDSKERLIQTGETRTWSQTGGGNLPGLDGGWRNGTAQVTMTRSFKGATDQLFNQCYVASVHAEHSDDVLDSGAPGDDFKYGYMQTGFNDAGTTETGIRYDQHGREADSWSMTAQPQKFDYVYLSENWFADLLDAIGDLTWNPETVEDNYGVLATISHSKVTTFDSLGRVVDSFAEFRRDDGNRTRGSETVSDTVYNPDGTRKSSLSTTSSDMRRLKAEGNEDDPYDSCVNAFYLAGWLSGYGGTWTLGKTAVLHQEYDGLYDDQNECGADGRNVNNYQYDIYGNVDQERTDELSSKDTWTTKDEGAGTTTFGWVLIGVVMAASLAAMAIPGVGAAIASAAISAFLVSSIQGASVENALIQAAISGALAGVASYATKGFKFADGAMKWAAAKGSAKLLSTAANLGINAALGNDLPFSGGPAATNPQALGSGTVLVAAKVSMVIAMNVGAASGEGSSGKMLMLAASAATGSLTGTGGSNKQGATRSVTRSLANAARQFMAVLAKAVVMKLTEQNDDQMSLSLGSALVQLSAGMGSRVMAAASQRSSVQRSESAAEAGMQTQERKNGSGGREAGVRNERADAPDTGAAQVTTASLAGAAAPGGTTARASGESYGGVTDRLARMVTAALGAAIDSLGNSGGYGSSSLSGAGSSVAADQAKDGGSLEDSSYSSQSQASGAYDQKNADISHMATGTGEKESSGVMYFGDNNNKGGNTSYSEKKSILEGLGIKVDNNILEGYFGTKAIADMKELLGAQKIDFDTVIGAKVNGKEMALFFKDDTLVAAGMVSASGQKEVRTFSFKLDEEGKVSVASGKIFREIAGKYVEVGAFVYAVQGSKEYKQAMARAGDLIQSGEALAKVKEANAVYTETDTAGNMTRRIYLKTDEAGNAVVLAAEVKAGDGKFKLLTYDDGIKSGGQGGLLAKGKIYEQESNGKYGKEAAGSFEIREMTGTANLSVNKSVAQVLSLGQNSRIVYKEQMKSGAVREVSMNKETGQLEYVYSKDANGKAQVIAFGNVKNQTVDGVSVTNFNSLSKEQQNDILASLPVMDSRDPATVTAKLVAMQNELFQARLQKLASERGWKMDAEKGQIFMKIPGGEGIQVMRMGEDRDGQLVIEGRMLVARDGEAGFVPAGPEVLMAPAQSAFARDLLSEARSGESGRFSGSIGTMYGSKGLSIVATVTGSTTKVSIIDSSENVLMTAEVSTKALKQAIDNLKSQQAEETKKGIGARVLESMRQAMGMLKKTVGGVQLAQ